MKASWARRTKSGPSISASAVHSGWRKGAPMRFNSRPMPPSRMRGVFIALILSRRDQLVAPDALDAEIEKTLHLLASPRHVVKDQAAGEREGGQQHQAGRQDRGGQARHQAGLDEGDEDRDRKNDRDRGEPA